MAVPDDGLRACRNDDLPAAAIRVLRGCRPGPFHQVDGTSVLTALKVTVDGNTWVSKPLATNGGDRLVTCGYTDPAGYVIVIVGLLTPAH